MDRKIKMALNQGLFDEDLMHFEHLYASPAKSDASSVDIYDGLDTVTLPEQTAEKNSPSRNCLDLYEEILTEEGTAKEASFNDLSAEYEKCQRQMKQLITKLKEMQSMNSSLQNENQCLKKNISALIKTARVEITRKEDEINRLNQRLGAPGKSHSLQPNPLQLLSINKSKSSNDVFSKDARNAEHLPKKAMYLQSKDAVNHYSKNLCDKEKTCMEISQTCTSTNPTAKQCKESTEYCSREQVFEPRSLELNKKERVLDSQNKDTERGRTKEKSKSIFVNSVSEISDAREKTCQTLAKSEKIESSQECRNSKSEVDCETEHRKNHSSCTKEKIQLKELAHSKEKQVKKYERSPHRKESRVYGKEKNTESRYRTVEQSEESRRSKRTHFSTPKDDGCHKVLELSDIKRSNDTGRRDKRSFEYRESKHGNKDSKPNKAENSGSNKSAREHKTERSDRDRRDGKKRSRDEQDRSRHNRKNKGQQVKEKDVYQSSSKDKGFHSKVSESKNRENSKEVDDVQKDLKLSFMETLNLTLSPIKKSSDDTEHEVSSAYNMKGEVEGNLASHSSQLCLIENNMDILYPKKTDLSHTEPGSVDDVTTKTLFKEYSTLVSHSGPVIDSLTGLNEEPRNSAVDESTDLMTKLTVEDKQVVCTDLDTVISEEMDEQCIVDGSDFIDLDSFIEIDRCSGSATPEICDDLLPAEQNGDDGSVTEKSEHVHDKAVTQTSNLAETTKGICESPDTVFVSSKEVENKHSFLDESSIDLNFIRHIPKVLSPLKSPIRPKVHLHRLERSAKASVVSTLHKELLPETNTESTCLLVSEELNKENCQPDKSDFGSKLASSDEVEEGEILIEEEQINKLANQLTNSPSQFVPAQVISVTKSQSGQDDELLALSKPDPLSLPPEKSANKRNSACPNIKRRNPSADSCLDGILKIVIPSSIQDVLYMLRIIRKHIRKKYMKFKVQFSLAQFHRIIEAATLCFITLIKNLDWTGLCSSPERLQKKLCRHIETRLEKLKNNGIVDRIFEQHHTDMKKRLWKFVEEQLDSLFDILKAVILKLCNKAEVENDVASCRITQKTSDPVKTSQNKKRKFIDNVSSPSSGPMPCLRRLEFPSQPRESNMKPQNDKAVQNELVKELTGIGSNSNVDIPSSNFSPTPKHSHLLPAKVLSNKPCPKSHPSSSGLSFDLVSDDHMGDIFKSLLNNSDNLPHNSDLPINTMPESMLLLGTPEKIFYSNQKFDNVDSTSENKTPTKAAFSWSYISPPNVHTFTGLESVLNPDVFDESCLLEIPTSASSNKSLNGSDDRLKSYSSVLFEDLAVSLTVPSPLKSDSHLSFLRPVCDSESISEVEIKCREGLVVDEEDATEQDIHLTLDSDNSSVGSLEDTVEMGSFQYHPSEPMQAVIMEKSNDHFIVKIRRAVSSSSPVSNCSSEEPAIAAPESVNTVEVHKLKLDTQSETHNGILLFHAEHTDLANIEENFVTSKRPEAVPLTIQENQSLFKLPPCKSHHLQIPTESKLHVADNVEHSEVDCEQNVTNCIEETCSQVPPDNILSVNSSDVDTVNLKKKRKSVEEEPSGKRQKMLSPPFKDQGMKHNNTKELENPNEKHKRAVSDGSINFHSHKVSPTNLSAKNVIKKKGEVVVSWTRDEDRAILLECQKLGPTKKTFLFLSSSMNKYPHQVEERFRQLMKLFKKSRNSSS